MIVNLEFHDKLWEVKAKVDGRRLDDPSTLKKSYNCDMVIKNPQNVYFMLNEVIDVDFEDV